MTLIDWYLRAFDFDRQWSLNVDLAPLHVHLYGRAVFLMWVTLGFLEKGCAACAGRAGRLHP